MRIFKNISIINSVDLFCSTIGNEFIFEKGNVTNLLLPCFNIGFYENEINQSEITKAIDRCYFLFENVVKCKVELSTYESILPGQNGTIDFDGGKFDYNFDFGKNIKDSTIHELSGVCYRYNSFSYGSYTIASKDLSVILLNESKFLNEYTSNESYKTDTSIQIFLSRQVSEYIDEIRKVF